MESAIDGGIEKVSDAPRLIWAAGIDADVEDVFSIAASMALGATDKHVGEELHFDLFESRATAAVALALGRIEAEIAGCETLLKGRFGLGEEFANSIEGADVNGGIGSRRPADGRLVHEKNAVQMLEAFESDRSGERGIFVGRIGGVGGFLIRRRRDKRVGLDSGLKRWEEDVAEEGCFSRTAHARQANETLEGDSNGEIANIVKRRSGQTEERVS